MVNIDLTGWAKEKLVNLLEELASIGDIAKDPETPDWYRRNLRSHLHPAFYDGLKLLDWVLSRDAWSPEDAQQPTEHGKMGLVALLNSKGITHNVRVDVPSVDPRDEDDREPTTTPEPPTTRAQPWASPLRQEVVKYVLWVLATRPLSDAEKRVLTWIAWRLASSDYEDIALVTRPFLGTDVGLTAQDGEAALHGLVEKKLVEFVPELDHGRSSDTVALRIVAVGLNERRNPLPMH
jgi:hypothetical protein